MRADIADLAGHDYEALAEFRYRIRGFLHFSEVAARNEGLEPQQHQMLLAIRALQTTGEATIGKLAGQLMVRHHSAVGLIDRLAEHGLVERVRQDEDRRQVKVRLTAEGTDKLRHLSGIHRQELRRSGPALVRALRGILQGLDPDLD
jgi:DNA-binding MarR family transcriptional regulator